MKRQPDVLWVAEDGTTGALLAAGGGMLIDTDRDALLERASDATEDFRIVKFVRAASPTLGKL